MKFIYKEHFYEIIVNLDANMLMASRLDNQDITAIPSSNQPGQSKGVLVNYKDLVTRTASIPLTESLENENISIVKIIKNLCEDLDMRNE